MAMFDAMPFFTFEQLLHGKFSHEFPSLRTIFVNGQKALPGSTVFAYEGMAADRKILYVLQHSRLEELLLIDVQVNGEYHASAEHYFSRYNVPVAGPCTIIHQPESLLPVAFLYPRNGIYDAEAFTLGPVHACPREQAPVREQKAPRAKRTRPAAPAKQPAETGIVAEDCGEFDRAPIGMPIMPEPLADQYFDAEPAGEAPQYIPKRKRILTSRWLEAIARGRSTQKAEILSTIAKLQEQGVISPLREEGNLIIVDPEKYYARYELLDALTRGCTDEERRSVRDKLRSAKTRYSEQFENEIILLNAHDAKNLWIPAYKGNVVKTLSPAEYRDRILLIGESEPLAPTFSSRRRALLNLTAEEAIATYVLPPQGEVLVLPAGKYCDMSRAARWIGKQVGAPIYERASVYHYKYRKAEETLGIPEEQRDFIVKDNIALVRTDKFYKILSPDVRHFVKIEQVA